MPSAGAIASCVAFEGCPCFLCLDSLSQAIRARAPVPWASPSVPREGLEAAVLAVSPGSPPLGLVKPTCILYLHFQAPVKTPPASNKTVQKSLTQSRTLGSQKQTPTKHSPCSRLLTAVGIPRFLCRSSIPRGAPCSAPTHCHPPAHLLGAGARGLKPPQLLACWIQRYPGHRVPAQSLRPTNWKKDTPNIPGLSWHPWFGVSLPSQPLAGTQPGQALNQPWGCANRRDPPSSPPPPAPRGVFLVLAEILIQINQGDTLGAPGGSGDQRLSWPPAAPWPWGPAT